MNVNFTVFLTEIWNKKSQYILLLQERRIDDTQPIRIMEEVTAKTDTTMQRSWKVWSGKRSADVSDVDTLIIGTIPTSDHFNFCPRFLKNPCQDRLRFRAKLRKKSTVFQTTIKYSLILVNSYSRVQHTVFVFSSSDVEKWSREFLKRKRHVVFFLSHLA